MTGQKRYLLLLVMLIALPSFSYAATTHDREIVFFKLSLNNKYWGVVTVLCDSAQYYIHLPELLTRFEYKHHVNYYQKTFKGYLSESDSTAFIIKGDSMGCYSWSDTEEFFVKSTEIEKWYGFKFVFTLGSLSVNMITEKGVPAVLRLLREEKVARMAQQKAARALLDIDTLRPKVFDVNSLGYSFNTSVGTQTDVSFNGNMAGEAFRGTYFLNYEIDDEGLPWSSNVKLDWKKPFLDKKWLKTIRVFHDINNMAISTDAYLTGVMLSNEDYTNRFIQGHLFQGRTTPNTDVEIYNNGQLIQYLKSDSLGNYQVEIPSYEGENNIKAVSYDSFGVPIVNESMVYLPPGLQRKKQVFYVASAGVNDYGELFSNISGEYGLLDHLTLGISSQTLFKYGNIQSIAMLTSKYTIRNRARIDLNYIPSVKFSSVFTGNIKGLVTGNITYETYNKKQNIIRTSITENFIASVNGSIPMRNVSGNYYLNVQYYKLGETRNYTSMISLNLWWRKWNGSVSFSTASQKMRLENPIVEVRAGYRFNNTMYNELFLTYRSFSGALNARNRFSYQFSNKLNSYCELNYNTVSKSYNVSLGVSWRLPWVLVRGGVQHSRTSTSAFANVSGAMLLHNQMDVAFTDRFVSGSSLLVVPFLDINGDGVKDKDEPVLKDTKLTMHARMEMQKTKHGILYDNVIPNHAFKIIVPRQTYEDITWQIEPQNICLVLAPHQFRTIELPVRILTELAGQVSLKAQHQAAVLNGLPITITNVQTGKVIHTRSDDWGYYSSMVVCGTYTIALDVDALDKSGVVCENPVRTLTIEPSKEGAQLIDLDFICIPKPEKSVE